MSEFEQTWLYLEISGHVAQEKTEVQAFSVVFLLFWLALYLLSCETECSRDTSLSSLANGNPKPGFCTIPFLAIEVLPWHSVLYHADVLCCF